MIEKITQPLDRLITILQRLVILVELLETFVVKPRLTVIDFVPVDTVGSGKPVALTRAFRPRRQTRFKTGVDIPRRYACTCLCSLTRDHFGVSHTEYCLQLDRKSTRLNSSH